MVLFGVYAVVGALVFILAQIVRAWDRMHTHEPIDFIEIFWQFIWLCLLFPIGLLILWNKLTK